MLSRLTLNPPLTLTTPLPLDALLQRLELAGFTFSPADRLRAWRVLAGPGKACLHDPKRLRYLLAPVLAKSAAEQALFYEVFEKYWADVMPEVVEPEPEPAQRRGVWDFLKKWWWVWVVAGVVGVFLAIYTPVTIKSTWTEFEPNVLKAYSLCVAGETINESHHWQDSLQHNIRWEVRGDDTDSIEYTDTTRSIHWKARATSEHYTKTIYLTARHKVTGVDTTELLGRYWVRCSNPPDSVQIITYSRNDSTFRFLARGLKEKNLRQEWKFSDGETASGLAATHTFQPGSHTVTFTLTRDNTDGICQTTATTTVSVAAQYPTLPFKPLLEDQNQPVAVLGPGFYLLLALLGAGAAWFFLLWLRRKTFEAPSGSDDSVTRPLSVNDRAPYDIPFRAQEASISVDRANYRLAQAMLRREDTEHSAVDVPASVRATVDGGGFPQLRSRLITNPSDYLILLDEQGAESHQAQLFKHLAQLLRGQDVVAEVFFYRNEFHRFWNRDRPDGISLDTLQRLYPHHRLVVLGDAHALLDPFADGPAALKRDTAAALTPWPRRLLLTPLPPVSWTYRERTLSRLFVVFPADLRGQADAALFLENGAAAEDLPPVFEHWQQAQAQARRNEPDLNYRRWRTAADHADYLAPIEAVTPSHRLNMYRWLCALAVCPRPRWPLSIAIGRALGAEVTFDNLLLLSRIPWLQKGELDPRLARDLRSQLSPDDERAARLAVAHELEAVAELTGDGFAEMERSTQLAMQQFALDPQDPERQETIRVLLAKGVVNRRMEGELNAIVARHVDDPNTPLPLTGPRIGTVTAREFLEEERLPPPAPPFWTKVLKQALTLAAAALLLGWAGFSLEKTDTLHRAVFGEKTAPAQEQAELRNRFFVHEKIEVDSAVWYNNRGVEVFREAATMPVKDDPIFGKVSDRTHEFLLRFASPDAPAAAAPFFEKASALRNGNYPLAAANLQKLRYNIGAGLFNQAVSGSSDSDARAAQLSEARSFFEKSDSTDADALHGAGLCWFFQYKIKLDAPPPPRSGSSAADAAKPFLAAAQEVYERIVRGYFDTLTVHPNLKELLPTGPVAYFAVSAKEGCVPFTVSFTNLSSHVPSSTYFEWSISDGTTPLIALSGFALFHTFEKPGIYDVRLVAKTVDGLSDTFTIKGAVRVIPPVVADFSFEESLKDAPKGTYSFTNLSTGASQWKWDFGDGTQGLEKHPTHRYSSNGPKAVTLTAFVGIGCQDTVVKIITPEGLRWLNVPQDYVLKMDSKKPEERLFKPDGVGLKEYHIAVFSRQGMVIWESTALTDGTPAEYWDGTLNGMPMPQSTYVWKVITAVFDDGTEYNGKRTGMMTLLRR